MERGSLPALSSGSRSTEESQTEAFREALQVLRQNVVALHARHALLQRVKSGDIQCDPKHVTHAGESIQGSLFEFFFFQKKIL